MKLSTTSSSACRRVRTTLVDPSFRGALPEAVAEHLEACAACSAVAAGLQAARRELVVHHAGIEPDGAFRARVAARLGGTRAFHHDLGWAAARLLPAALALAAGLALLASPGRLGLPGTPVLPVELWLMGAPSDEALLDFLLGAAPAAGEP
jgi:hypothetical protein